MLRPLVQYAALWQRETPPVLADFLRDHTLELAELVDLLRLDQAERWRRGETPGAETYLAHLTSRPDATPEHAVELIYAEFCLRQSLGQRPVLAEYLERFPAHAERLRQQVDFAAALDGEPTPHATLHVPTAEMSVTLHRGDGGSSLAVAPTDDDDEHPAVPGYVIEKELGRGGMGVVYLARDTRLGRRVALKMIIGGMLARPETRMRFLFEAEIAARLRHPHIVAIHEVGTYRGSPYFALEFVPGGTLAQQMQGRQFGPREAAELVERLARALQVAHLQGIVHRDLKPANVLLDQVKGSDEPLSLGHVTPKITDFGLAKLMAGDSGLTATGAVLGTPSYMAPEQAASRPEAICPATDVYSLGAILYELLAGRPPYKEATAVDTMMKILEQDPPPLGQVRPGLPRDLLTIVEKCLRREPSARYAAAGELADELERWRRDLPIRARPVGTMERLGKWARRRPAAAALVAVCMLATIGLITVISIYAAALRAALKEAQAENRRADENLLALHAAVEDFTDLLESEPRLQAVDLSPVRAKLLEKAVPLYERIVQQKQGDPELEAARGRAFGKLAVLRRDLGDPAKALRDAQAMYDIFLTLHRANPQRLTFVTNLTLSCINRGGLLGRLDRSEEALACYAQAQGYAELAASLAPNDASAQGLMVKIGNNRARLLNHLGRHEEALALYGQAHKLGKELVARFPDEASLRADLATLCVNQAMLLDDLQRPGEARALMGEALALRQELARRAPRAPEPRLDLATVRNALGLMHSQRGEADLARENFDAAIRLLDKLVAEFPNLPDYRSQLANVWNNLSLLEKKANQGAAAVAALDRAIALHERLVADHPDVVRYRMMLATQLANSTSIDPGAKRSPAARLAALDRAEQVLAPLITSTRVLPEVRSTQAMILRIRGDLLADQKQVELAIQNMRAAEELLVALVAESPQFVDYQLDLCGTRCNLGHLFRDLRRSEEAFKEYARAAAELRQILARDPGSDKARTYLLNTVWGQANVCEQMGRFREAADFWTQALELATGGDRTRLRFWQALAWARGGAVDEAAAAAESLAKIDNLTQRSLIAVARMFAIAANHLPTSDSRRAAWEQRCLEELKKARAKGPIPANSLLPEGDFACVARRPEFNALLGRTPAPPIEVDLNVPLAEQGRRRIAEANRELKDFPNSTGALMRRGEGHALCGDYRAAIADADAALSLLPPDSAQRQAILLTRAAWQLALEAQQRLGGAPKP